MVCDNDGPAKIDVFMPHIHETTSLKEWQCITRVSKDFAPIIVQLCERFVHSIVGGDVVLVWHVDSVAAFFGIDELGLKFRHRCCLLELEETIRQHVLGRNAFYTHKVQNHVVAEMEGTVQPISLTFDHEFRR